MELLARILVAASMGLQQVTAAVRKHDRDVAPAVQPNGADESLLAQMTQVAAAGTGFAPRVIAQVSRGHDPKRADGRQRAGLRATERVRALTRVMNDFSLAPPRQIETPHEDVTRIESARISIPLRPSLAIAIPRVF